MQKEIILENLKDILLQIKPKLNTEAIDANTRLTEDLGIDSLTMLLLSFSIEQKYGFQFDGAIRFTTVGEVMEYIEEHTR